MIKTRDDSIAVCANFYSSDRAQHTSVIQSWNTTTKKEHARLAFESLKDTLFGPRASEFKQMCATIEAHFEVVTITSGVTSINKLTVRKKSTHNLDVSLLYQAKAMVMDAWLDNIKNKHRSRVLAYNSAEVCDYLAPKSREIAVHPCFLMEMVINTDADQSVNYVDGSKITIRYSSVRPYYKTNVTVLNTTMQGVPAYCAALTPELSFEEFWDLQEAYDFMRSQDKTTPVLHDWDVFL